MQIKQFITITIYYYYYYYYYYTTTNTTTTTTTAAAAAAATTTTTTTTTTLVILYLKCMDYIIKLRAQSSQRISNQLSIFLSAMTVFLCLLVCSSFWWFSF